MKFTTKNIAYLAILVAINVLMNVLTFTVPGTGVALSFTYIPTFLAGFYFGPGGGFLVGALGDVLGWLINSSGGAWLPFLTLSSGLMGVIPGLMRRLPFNQKWIVVLSYVVTYLLCSVAINTTIFWYTYIMGKKTFWVYLIARLPITLIVMIANLILNIILMPFFDKLIAPRVKKVKSEE